MKKRLFLISIIALFMGLVLTFIYFKNPSEGVGFIPCPIYLIFKVYCPGCGAARALYSIMHFEISKALSYNPMFVILLPFVALYIACFSVGFIKHGRDTVSKFIPYKLAFWVLIIVLIYGVIRNIPFPPFSYLAPI